MHLVQFGQQNLSGFCQEQHLELSCSTEYSYVWMCINRIQTPGKLLRTTSMILRTEPQSVLTDTRKVEFHHTARYVYYSSEGYAEAHTHTHTHTYTHTPLHTGAHTQGMQRQVLYLLR